MQDYTILEKLGEGGMGQVFRAMHHPLRRHVAIKLMTPSTIEDVELQKRFRREVKLLCSLSHPNIVPVFDGGVLAGRPYFSMELVEGRSLDSALSVEGALPAGRVVELLRQAADALVYLHAKGIQHRDIKPRNLILTTSTGSERLVLVDFGLARAEGARALTKAGEIIGTVSYLAPEALEAAGGPPRDIWALGVTAWEMLSGTPLFTGSQLEIALALTEFDPARIRRSLDHVPGWLRDLVLACLAPRPELRPTAPELLARLDAGFDEGAGEGAGAPARSGSPSVLPGRRFAAWKFGVPAAVLGLVWFLAAGPAVHREFPGTGVSPSPGPIAAPRHEAVVSLPREVTCLTSESTALVDLELGDPATLELTLVPWNGAGDGDTVRPAGRSRVTRVTFSGLAPDSLHCLTVRTVEGEAVLEGYPVHTRDEDHMKTRERALRELGTDGAFDELLERPDPRIIPLLVSRLAGGRNHGLPAVGLARMAEALKEPALIRPLLEDVDALGDHPRAVILDAAVAARVIEVTGRALLWLDQSTHAELLAACARVLGMEGLPGSCARIAARVEAIPGWCVRPVLEAMIRCHRSEARSRFRRWIATPAFASQGALGLDLLGEPPDLENLVKFLGTSAGALDQSAGTYLGDRAGPAAREALRERLGQTPSPVVVWACARAGEAPGVTVPGDPPPVALSRMGATALLEDPGDEWFREATRMTASEDPAGRSLAISLLANQAEDRSRGTLEALAFSPGDPDRVAAWGRARLAGPLPVGYLDRLLAILDPAAEGQPLPQVLSLLAANRLNPARTAPFLAAVREDSQRRGPLKDLARWLHAGESVPSSRVEIVTSGTYHRTGIVLRRGEALHVRGWGLHVAPDDPSKSTYFSSDPGRRWPGPNFGMVLHRGRQEWFVGREWRTFLAREAGEVLLSPIARHHLDTDNPLERVLAGVILLEVLRDPAH